MSWQPLLDGEDAIRAREAIAAIAADLATRTIARPDLDEGYAGQALLAAYLARGGDDAAAERAVDALELALAGLDHVHGPWLLDGLSGVAWTAAHLASDLADIDGETMANLDGLVVQVLAAEPWPFLWEHLAGVVGLGVYALERGSTAMQARVVDHLTRLTERSEAGATWRSPARPGDDEVPAAGYHNLGLAHGVVGVIAFLSRAVDAAGTSELLADAVRWLRPHDTGDPAGRFPYWIERPPRRGRRDGWCYGDQGVAIALVRAGQALGEESWVDHGLAVALDVARRAPDLELDACLCHGTVGRAHLFNRLAQATASDELAEAARSWYRETLARRQPGLGIGGYRGEPGFADESVLLGATGIALGLVAAIAPVEPAWDRVLLVDLPPEDAG